MELSVQGLNDRTYVVAADEEGRPVGVMGMVPPGEDMRPFVTTEKPIEFINAYVDPNQRSKGLGQALAAKLEEKAVQAGHTEVVVRSGPRYEKSGYPFWTRMYGQPVSVQKDFYGAGYDSPVWRKRLA
jgi:GNAT superfamily N-acetyltransferase